MKKYKVEVGLYDLVGDDGSPFCTVNIILNLPCKNEVLRLAEIIVSDLFPELTNVIYEAIGEPVLI